MSEGTDMDNGSEATLLRIREVALLLRLGESTVKAMVQRGELPVVRCGRAVRIPRRELKEWVAQRTERASGLVVDWFQKVA